MTTARPTLLKACEACGDTFTARQQNSRYCRRNSCQRELRKVIEKYGGPTGARWMAQFPTAGLPLKEWRVEKLELSALEEELASEYGGSVCFRCKFLQVCRHQVALSFRTNKVYLTWCEF